MFHLRFLDSEQNNLRPWRISIVGGTGAVGAYFAMQFLLAGHSVSIIGRDNSQSLKHIHDNGLTLITSEGKLNRSRKEFHYVGDFAHFPKEKTQDLVIISLKQYDMCEAIAQNIAKITDENSIVAVIANGLPFYFLRGLNYNKGYLDCVDPGGKISVQLKGRQIVGIQPVIASRIVSPGIIQVLRPLASITVALGSPENRVSKKMDEMHQLFNIARIKTTLTATDLRKNILEKLQFALAINTLSAIMEQNIGYVFDSKDTQVVIAYSISVINQIALALGMSALRSYQQLKSLVITKDHFSSLYHDIQAGKPGEGRMIVDATIELAEFLQVFNTQIPFPKLEPLKLLKCLLLEKSQKVEKNKFQIKDLFEACHIALESFPKEKTMKIRSKL